MADLIFAPLADDLLNITNTVTSSISGSIISGFTGVILISGTLYFTLMGFMIIGNYVQTPLSNFIKASLRFGLIVGLVLFSGEYTAQIVPAMEGLQVGIASLFTGSGGSLGTGATVFNVLDDGILKAWDLITAVNSLDRSFYDPSAIADYIIMLLVAIVAVALFGRAAAYIIIAQVMFLILLAIGPLFILMLLFGGITAQWFDRWFGQTLTYILQVALVSLVAVMAISIFSGLIPSPAVLATYGFLEFVWLNLQMMAVGMILFTVLGEANSAAGQLAGGISSGGSNLIGIAAAAYGGTMGKALAKSTRDKADGTGEVTKSRIGHLRQGNTMLNPAYRQAMAAKRKENNKKQWGSGSNEIKKN